LTIKSILFWSKRASKLKYLSSLMSQRTSNK